MARSNPLLLLHGVPDTPALWGPLRAKLAPREGPVLTPALPGFSAPWPKDFEPTKDGYAGWLIEEVERIADQHGPIDLVGHDWGALLATRALSLRPDLFASWVVSSAAVQGDYPGHLMAHLWNTPVLGELTALIPRFAGERILRRQGMPEQLARTEAGAIDAIMRRSVLGLYRSTNGLSDFGHWLDDLDRMPKRGLVIWGERDPYVPPRYGEAFAKEQGFPFRMSNEAGHWVVAEDPSFVAAELERFWEEH